MVIVRVKTIIIAMIVAIATVMAIARVRGEIIAISIGLVITMVNIKM